MAVAKYSHVGEVLRMGGLTQKVMGGGAGNSFLEGDSWDVLERYIKGGELTAERSAVSSREDTSEGFSLSLK